MPLSGTPVTTLHGIGPQLADKLARLDIHELEDLLWHLPLRYRDLTRITPIGALNLHNESLVEGVIRGCDVVFGKRRSLLCLIQDNTGIVALRFYHFSRAQQLQLVPGKIVRAWGETRRGTSGFEMYHPEYRVLEKGEVAPLTEQLTPVYPATEGLQQARLRKLLEQAMALVNPHAVPDWIPSDLLPERLKLELHSALTYLHQPPVNAPVSQLQEGRHPAQQRLAFEELVAHHLSLLRARASIRQEDAHALSLPQALHDRFIHALPFRLTDAQQRVSADIAADLSKPYPMLRLVQGDVGSGKTVVAALAILQTIACGKQAALMAPTEILAAQHFQQFCSWFETLGFRVVWLSGSQKIKERRETLAALAEGCAHVAIGTHALFQEEVAFRDLALVITDEQHRFGVRQRLALQQKGVGNFTPHQLVMTATPIPRTLAMSAYADMDCSVIDERPPGRTPVQTIVLGNERRAAVIERLRAACHTGRQAYWVCTLIEESDVLQYQAAEQVAEELRAALPDCSIGLIHGRQKPIEKEAVMAAFKAGELSVLVATTVIEVGVDVPNASLMIIENPERLGLAQLHQLRGRVGRGRTASHCVLLYASPLSQTARARLAVLRDSDDGFVIAEKDLQIRGPGELLGTRQTGDTSFRIADLTRDANWLPDVKHCAENLLTNFPEHIDPLIRRWLRAGERYART